MMKHSRTFKNSPEKKVVDARVGDSEVVILRRLLPKRETPFQFLV